MIEKNRKLRIGNVMLNGLQNVNRNQVQQVLLMPQIDVSVYIKQRNGYNTPIQLIHTKRKKPGEQEKYEECDAMGSCEVDIQQTKEHDETREENKRRR